MINFFRRIIFWGKKRVGFLDLGREITVTGEIVAIEYNPSDGDHTFDLELDPESDWAGLGFGGIPNGRLSYLHCEIVSWLPVDRAPIVGGRHVRVTGRWAFDGVHFGYPGWLEILLAVLSVPFGRAPNFRKGWNEIHPVTQVRAL